MPSISDCVRIVFMSTLPNVSATETADLHDVHKRLAKAGMFSYFRAFWGEYVRVYQFVHSFWPRLF